MRTFVSLGCLSILLLLPGLARAQRCEAPRVLLTVDKSSSMLGQLPGGDTKWDAARAAIGELTTSYADSIDFGMQVFPYPSQCSPGEVTMDFGTHVPEDFMVALGDPPPTGGNWTPMAQTLDAAAAYLGERVVAAGNHLVLITDGWQWCDPYEAATRFTPVEAVTRLRELGVTVHVVGFGGGVDSLTLNRAAVAAGTDLPGCDSTLSDPAALNHCYLQANDLMELREALDSIGRLVTDELCDGLDNDCDGTVDEGYDRDMDGFTVCGSDTSEPGLDLDPELRDCDDSAATVYPGAEELCDGLDNDCDGVIDPGCDCLAGETRACGSVIGACVEGMQVCDAGAWGACEGGVSAADGESCDGTDEDCDGEIDEDADASCEPGQVCRPEGCVDLNPPMDDPVDPVGDDAPEMKSGCACRAVGAGPGRTSTSVVLFLLGLAGLTTLRRRRARG